MLSVSKFSAFVNIPLYQVSQLSEVVLYTLSNGKTSVGLLNVTFTSVINDCDNAEPDV